MSQFPPLEPAAQQPSADHTGLLPGMISDYTTFYADAYTLRRNASSQQPAALTWLRERLGSEVTSLALKPDESRPLRMVSIGCGGGELDLAMLHSLSSMCNKGSGYTGVDLTGMEPSISLRAEFVDRVEQAKRKGDIPVELNLSFDERVFDPSTNYKDDSLNSADIVFMGHVLYYFDDKAEAIAAALKLVRPGGKLVIVHHGAEGVPELQKQLLPEYRGSMKDVYTADNIEEVLFSRRLNGCNVQWARHDIDAYLDLAEIESETEAGMTIMSFCLEADHRSASKAIMQRSRDAFLAKSVPTAEPGRRGGPFMKDPVTVFLISPPN